MASRVRGQETIWEDRQFPGVDCSESPDRARQEFKAEADLNVQLRRYGIGQPWRSGSVDFNLDLQSAIALVNESREAWKRLPSAVRERYRNWAEVDQAAASGELAKYLKPAADAAGGSAAADGGSASVSAPVSPTDG